MPFTFKLSQRLARMRSIALLATAAALVACEKPLPLAAPTGTLARLVVSPKLLTVRQSQSADFAAVGLTNDGDTANVAVSWSATSGVITNTGTTGGMHYGRYQAGTDTGRVRVIALATSGGAADTALVTVTLVPVASVPM